jgi:hypothetical protein
MDTLRYRSERSKKAKQIFSPSDPLQPYYYLVTYDCPEKYRIIGRTSIQKITKDKAVLTNVDGEVQIVASGKIIFASALATMFLMSKTSLYNFHRYSWLLSTRTEVEVARTTA